MSLFTWAFFNILCASACSVKSSILWRITKLSGYIYISRCSLCDEFAEPMQRKIKARMFVVLYYSIIIFIIAKTGIVYITKASVFCWYTISLRQQGQWAPPRHAAEVNHWHIKRTNCISIIIFYFNSCHSGGKYTFIFSKVTKSLIWYFCADRWCFTR